jgi:hypothetical protein
MQPQKEKKLSVPKIKKNILRLGLLLENLNHFWAMELNDDILNNIEIINIPNSEKLHYYNEIIKVWESHLRFLVTNFFNNWPFIYNAYHQLFEILFKIKDFTRIANNGILLAKNLSKINFASPEQIAGLLESIVLLIVKSKDFRSAVEILYIAIYFRGMYQKTEAFDECFTRLNIILRKLSTNQRPILLNCFLSNIYNQFFGETKSDENKPISDDEIQKYRDFIGILYRSSVNAVDPALRDGLTSVKKMLNQIRGTSANLDISNETIFNLQMMNEHSWAFSIALNYCQSLRKEDKNRDAVKFLQNYIDTSFRQGGYDSCFQSYKYITKWIKDESLQFDLNVARIWTEAAAKFRKLTDKSYFVASIEEFKEMLKIPEDYSQIQDFSFAINEYYRLARGFIRSSEKDFWWVVLHRCVFEQGFEDIAKRAARELKILELPFASKFFLEEIPKTIRQIKSKKDSSKEISIGGMNPEKITIKLRIPKNNSIKINSQLIFASGYVEERLIEIEERWQEPILDRFYFELPQNYLRSIDTKEKVSQLNQYQFSKLAYIMLPKELREFNIGLKVNSTNVPEVYTIIDEPTYPFEMIHDQKAPLGIKYAFGYRNREPQLNTGGNVTSTLETNPKFNILSISDFNRKIPKIWNEEKMKSDPMVTFTNAIDQSQFFGSIINDFKHLTKEHIGINGQTCTKGSIDQELVKGSYHVIYICSNLFYLENNPIESFFLTPDQITISLGDMLEMLSYARKHNRVQNLPYTKPLIILDGQVILESGQVLPRTFNALSKIFSQLSSKHVMGIFTRISNEFNEPLQVFLKDFMERILMNESIGSALLTANRHLYVTGVRLLKSGPSNLELVQRLQETHYVFSGDPFKKLDYK